ncbi:nitronate monooxygenase family protein [soil metagenome]
MTTSFWPDSRLADLLSITHPIVQAPMKSAATPALAAAVSNAGGLGSLGCAGLAPQEIHDTLSEMRRRTNRAFNLNFFAHGPVAPGVDDLARARARLAPFYAEKGLGEPPAGLDPAPAAFGDDHLEALLADPPAVVSFHFGLPENDAVARLKAAGARILCTATTVAEARALEAAGIDAIIAQGWEAGGHRGAFDITADDAGIGLMALVPQVVDAVSLPVIAADDRGIAAALALGASCVQIGTAFIPCPESAAPEPHRAAIAAATGASSRLTRAVSGRPARAHRTRYIDALAAETGTLPAFPLMYALSGPLAATGDPDFRFLLYGQAAPLARPRPAAGLFADLVADTGRVLARTRSGG